MSIDLSAEANLDSSIRLPASGSGPESKPKAIFLTGATGFLGAYLLSQLLEKTEATIYALVRAKSAVDAQQRLQKNLAFYRLWREACKQRVVPVVGDISKPCLGLPERRFYQLADRIGVIYHSAAQTTPVYPYAMLKAVNVIGTQEVIRLAATTRVKTVHYVSSTTVFSGLTYRQQSQPVLEMETPALDVAITGGYKQSKWVAEQLLWQAKARGLAVAIYRVGRIVADEHTGIMAVNLFWKVVKGCLLLKEYPHVSSNFNLVPVDYVSRAMVFLSLQSHSPGRAFHLVNSDLITWSDLWQQIRSLGYAATPICYDDWLLRIKQRAETEALFAELQALLRSPTILFKQKLKFDDRQTQGGLASSGIVCPAVNNALLRTYLNYVHPMR